MIEVRIENKEANHYLMILGNLKKFEDGSLFVSEEEARFIRELKDPQYEIIEPVKPKEVKKVSKSKPRPKKAKKE